MLHLSQISHDNAPLTDCDQDHFSQIIERYKPLVRSICRQTLPADFDPEDAVQETFIKLLRHGNSVHSNMAGWLTMTARNICIDQMRRYINEKNRIEHWSQMQNQSQRANIDQQLKHLDQAMQCLTDDQRQFLVDRFFHHRPLRVLAQMRNISVPTMSRYLKKCLADLSRAYEDLYRFEQTPISANDANRVRDGRLLFEAFHPSRYPDTRPERLRVGFFLGWSSTLVRTYEGFVPPLERQLATTGSIENPAWDLVGIVEPDTWAMGKVESTLRQYELLDGMVDASRVEELCTLDAIFIGDAFCMLPRVMNALIKAVENGVGLYNESTCGSVVPGWSDKRVLKLKQAQEAASYHTIPTHDMPTDATVHQTHPCLPGFKVGTKLTVGGCGPVCSLEPGVQMLIAKDHMVTPTHDAKPHMTPNVRPVMTAGHIGKGRVINLHLNDPWAISKHPAYQGHFYNNVIHWVARRTPIDSTPKEEITP